ncbi:MAG TPA: phosphohydrolase, partial [Candidatus Ozemobacteraceae bacterium]|nr:phosphohydrolase [Candidatus Ozemobacteraceae bacterium]
MNTKTGRQLAEQRHAFLEQYLEQFFAEWQGER